MLYDAFVSYSHAADGTLAPAIQRALHNFAKPWYKLRALRVFRDKTTLSATPGLWPAIESALSQSEWFLYLASPQAAQSQWVNQEITWWMTHRSSNRMLILLTDGELTWDSAAHDFDWTRTTAAARSLAGSFADEPLYVDLRWAKTQDNLTLKHLNFRSAMLDVAAPIHGRAKDELDGDDVRAQRRNKRWAWSAGIMLAVLAILASAAAVAAVQQRNQAEARRQIAFSRQVATQALNYLGEQRVDTALLLAIESQNVLTASTAATEANTFDARSSLLAALAHGVVPIRSHMHGGNHIAFSPDSRLLASASGDKLMVWDVATGQPVGRPFPSHDDAVFAIAFSPDGKTITTGSRSDKNLRFWNLETRGPDGEPLTVHGGSAITLAISPDGRTLATGGGDKQIVLWNLATREPMGEPLTGHTLNVESLDFSRDGRTLASGSWDGTVILWDVGTRTALGPPLSVKESLGQSFGQVEGVAVSPDGRLLAAGGSGGAVLWDVASRKPLSPLLKHPSGGVTSVAISPDGRYLAAGGSGNAGTVMLWNIRTFEPGPQPLLGHMKWIDSVRFSPDGTVLASAGGDDSIITRDLDVPHRLASVFPGYEGPSYTLALSPDGILVAADICVEFQGTGTAERCSQSAIRIWNRASGKEAHTLRTGRPGPPAQLRFPTADSVVSGSCAEGNLGERCRGIVVERWDLRSERVEQHRIDTDHPDLDSLAMSPDATIIAAGGCKSSGASSTDCSIGEIRLFDVRGGTQIGTSFFGHSRGIDELAFSPDARTLVSSTLDDVIAWSVSTRKPIARPEAGSTVAFSRDGALIAVASPPVSTPPRAITLRTATTGQPVGELIIGDSDVVLEMAFSPDGSLLAVSSVGNGDAALTVWDVPRRSRLGQPLQLHSNRAFGLAFTPDGKAVITSTEERGVLSWDVDPESWRARACSIANRNLTYDEWTQFLGSEPYRRTCPSLPIDPNMAESGRRRARSGDIDGAVAIFQRLGELSGPLPFNPRKEAIKFSVEELVANGRYLAQSGDVDGGTARLEQAKRLDPALPIDAGVEARKLAAPVVMATGARLAEQGQIGEAVAAFARAQAFDSTLQGSAAAWNTLCWHGTLRGKAADVLAACDRAIAIDPDDGRLHTGRGLARATTGKVDQAIADFKTFLAWEKEEQTHRMGLAQRQSLQAARERHEKWIAELGAGRNPFTPRELQQLLDDTSAGR